MKKFNVFVNPFTKVLVVENDEFINEFNYEDLDWRNDFKFEGQIYDIHFMYDGYLSVEIFKVINNLADYSKDFVNDVEVAY